MSVAIQRAFSGGEITPGLYARIDVAKYVTGLKTCRNFIVLKHGGAYNRSGTGFVSEVKDSSKTIRLIPFIFSDEQTYVLEFGNLYMRVIRNGIPQYDLTLTITGISNASQAVLSYTGTDPANGDEVYVSTVIGPMASFVNGRNFKIANVNAGANTFELLYMDGTPVDSTAFGLYTSGGTAKRVYTIVTPYLEADLPLLKYSQSADVVTLTHRSYPVQRLTRTGHTSWTIVPETFAPTQAAPASPSNDGGGGSGFSWVITAIAEETYEESLASAVTSTSTDPGTTPVNISWSAASGALEYNVYRALNGVYGFIGVARGTTFKDDGIDPDTTITPPDARDPFAAPNDYPGTSGYAQQRQIFGNTYNETEKVFTSKSGAFRNMSISSPLQDDDAVTWNLAGVKVNAIEHIMDLDGLIVFTSGSEVQILGDSNGVLRPGQVNPKTKSYWGSSHIKPVVIGNTALFVQARTTIIRDLYNDSIEGFKGNDLTIFSSHLFENEEYEIVDFTYQQLPNSNAWAVRNDGVLLGLTYIREQQFLAWHRHDTDGIIENVVSVPEGTEDALYVCVKRTINGQTKRYNERFKKRRVDDVVDYVFADCSLSYDGRNTEPTTMTLSGSGWTPSDTLTMTASASFFSSDDVGNQIFLYDDDEQVIRFTITGFTSDLIVTGVPHMDVPVSLQSLPRTTWSKAIISLKGLWHLEGKDISIFGDGFVAANPNNSAYSTVTVENGVAALEKPYAVIHAGLPFTSDIETLDIDSGATETMIDKNKLITEVIVYVRDSRGFWAGTRDPLSDSSFTSILRETKLRNAETMNEPISLRTSAVPVKVQSTWDAQGHVFVRNTDPIPLEILAIAPKGFIPAFAKGA